MLDACTITRGAGESEFDPVTGTYSDPAGTSVYEGKCKVQQRPSVSAESVGADVASVLAVEVHVPMSVTGVEIGDTVTITSSVYDQALVDRSYRVVDDPAKSYATARRLQCEEVRT